MAVEKRVSKKQAISDQQLRQIQQAAESIDYGAIHLVFQDGVLVQIDRSEKIRVL
ncbi:DUF2292 domain-containing protein [Oscillibacter sp. GMB15532]|uniref:DUF2292 domain-containing protein n=1 Tax=Oscillibacter sp. GMB15532 TaxID=3230022 RepID=UPI0034DFD3F1